jgi:membrane associated rhomboid family serine protease
MSIQHRLSSFRFQSPVIQLLVINMIVFVLIKLYSIATLLIFHSTPVMQSKAFQGLVDLLAMPYEFSELLTHFYTPITYMFVHLDFLHVLFNMLALYFFGNVFTSTLDEKKVWPLYIFGGLAGALISFTTQYIPAFQGLSQHGHLVGASASIMSILVATAIMNPNLPMQLFFVGEVKLKYVAVFYVLIDLASISSGKNLGGHTAHFGGMLMGIVAAYGWKKGFDITAGWGWLSDKIKSVFLQKKSKMKVVRGRPLSDDQFNTIRKEKEITLDQILDKINKKGIDSLTPKEKELLDKFSRN